MTTKIQANPRQLDSEIAAFERILARKPRKRGKFRIRLEERYKEHSERRSVLMEKFLSKSTKCLTDSKYSGQLTSMVKVKDQDSWVFCGGPRNRKMVACRNSVRSMAVRVQHERPS